jgi:hypothetical protein
MTWTRTRRHFLLAAGLLLSACLGPRRAPENVAAARLKDSAPEKIAAQRAATPGLEAEDERWGIDAAAARKRERDDKRDREQKRAQAAAKITPSGAATVEVAPAPLKP